MKVNSLKRMFQPRGGGVLVEMCNSISKVGVPQIVLSFKVESNEHIFTEQKFVCFKTKFLAKFQLSETNISKLVSQKEFKK